MFNYVILGYNLNLYKKSFNEVLELENVRYIPNLITKKRPPLYILTSFNIIFYLFYKIHHSGIINRLINLPFKRLWFGFYFKNNFKNLNPICFIFFSRNLTLEKYGYLEFLRRKYPDSKFVCFFSDLMNTHVEIDILEIKKLFDLVISYDLGEANKYDVEYHPTVYSKTLIEQNDKIKKSDVYFLGAVKNRFAKIILIYKYLKRKGLKCEFYLTNVKPEEQIHDEGLHYISQMTYQENLQHVLKTECILEIMQSNATGYTMRTWEAIMYDKKLLTDNTAINNAPFYNTTNIFVFENIENLEDNKLFFENFSRKADHQYKENISPIKLLEFIEKKLK